MNDKVTELMAEVHAEIMRERIRQNYKWGVQRHPLPVWYVILGEEFGEVGQAIQRMLGMGKESDADNLYEEFIHVAAVAMAAAEQIREVADLERIHESAEKTEARTGKAPGDPRRN